MSTLDGVQIEKWELYASESGCYRVDVTLTEGSAPSGHVALKAGTLTLNCQVLRSWLDSVDKPHAILVGGLGWQSHVNAPISYQSDSGVRLNSVLSKLAGLAREKIELPVDMTIGEYYELVASRPGEPVTYADALNGLVRHGYCPPWRVDPDGVTRFGTRTAKPVTTRATPMSPALGVGIRTYGLDDPADFLPGNTIDGILIRRIQLREANAVFEVDAYQDDAQPSLRDLVRRMIAEELGDRVRTYVVVACHADGRCDLSPPPDATHLPELRNVEQWINGASVFRASKGDLCTVEQRDARGSRPIITHFKKADGEEFPPDARQGDYVVSGGAGTFISFSVGGVSVFPVFANPSGPPVPATAPCLVSFGLIPPTPISMVPLYGAVASGSQLSGTKR